MKKIIFATIILFTAAGAVFVFRPKKKYAGTVRRDEDIFRPAFLR